MILMAYCTTFLVWKHAAMGHASSQGLVGYYFFWPSSVSNVRREKVTRLIFFPIITIDVDMLGGTPPASPPTGVYGADRSGLIHSQDEHKAIP